MSDTQNPIAKLNDLFRLSLGQSLAVAPGQRFITPEVHALRFDEFWELMYAVSTFADFTPDNDPYGEHDFGSIEMLGEKWFWKIDYYSDDQCQYGSEDPADPQKCFRVLTIMATSEY